MRWLILLSLLFAGQAYAANNPTETIKPIRQEDATKAEKIVAAANRAFPLRVVSIRQEPSALGVRYLFKLDARKVRNAPDPYLIVHVDAVENAAEADLVEMIETLAADVKDAIASRAIGD